MLAAHVPDENEDWMKFELSRLSQFTRIFPAGDPRFKSKGHEDIDRDDDNNDNGWLHCFSVSSTKFIENLIFLKMTMKKMRKKRIKTRIRTSLKKKSLSNRRRMKKYCFR